MIAILLQLKMMKRDKFVMISLLLPIVLAVLIKWYLPAIVIDVVVGVVDDRITHKAVAQLSAIATVENFQTTEALQKRVLETSDHLIGIIQNNTGEYTFLLQGNEPTYNIKSVDVINAYLTERIDHTTYDAQFNQGSSETMHHLITTLIVLTAFFMGSTVNAFNIVTEKANGVDIVNRTIPMSKQQYMIQKLALGFIGALLTALIAMWILEPNVNWLLATLLLISASILAAILGLYLGRLADDLIAVIISTKITLLLFIFVPVIGHLAPDQYLVVKRILYIVPSVAIFEAISSLLKQTASRVALYQIAYIMGYSGILYILFYYKLYRK